MKPDSTGQGWQRVDELFTAALERHDSERDAFLAESCRDDDALRREVESFLKAHGKSAGFMQSAVYDDAMRLIAEGEEGHYSQKRIGRYKLLEEIGCHSAGFEIADYAKAVKRFKDESV
jgi:hypothetical protein